MLSYPRQDNRSRAIDLPLQAETRTHDKQPSNQKPKSKEFAIAHNPFWKKQKQERFLRQSHGEDSRKPIAIRANQAILKNKIKSVKRKAIYAKEKRTILVEIPNTKKQKHLVPQQA